MNLQHLYYFKTLAEIKNFSRAAEALYISQPGLSYAISSLEKELGETLISREGKEVALTEKGRVFLDYVNMSLKDLEDARQAMSGTAPAMGEEKVRAIVSRPYLLLEALEAYPDSTGRPRPRIQIIQNPDYVIAGSLRTERYDFVINTLPASSADFECTPIRELPMLLVVPLGHPLAQRQSIDMRELDKDSTFIARNTTDMRYRIEYMCSLAGIEYSRVTSYVGFSSAIANYVELGMGIGICEAFPGIKNYRIRTIPIEYPILPTHNYLIKKREHDLRWKAQDIYSFIRDNYGDK